MLSAHHLDGIAASTGSAVAGQRGLAHGNNARLIAVSLTDGRELVVKIAAAGAKLDLEGFMLDYLHDRSDLPVPRVYWAEDDVLAMDRIDGGGGITAEVERHAAALLAALHGITADRYGFERDTLIGPLPQPNPPADDWIVFFRDHRLLHMARHALDEGGIGPGLMRRIERLADRLPALIGEPAPPCLIHGDVWGGNVLARDGRVAGFIDPAIYYADPEIELAFSTLFSTFGSAFFRRYGELRPLRDGFFEVRRDLYNLYPLLVHVRLFGGSYVGSVDRIVTRLAG